MAAALLVAIKAGKIPGIIAEGEASKDWRSIVVELENRIAALRKAATLRDRFASDAMAAMDKVRLDRCAMDNNAPSAEDVARMAYRIADAMMAERERTNG